MINLRKLESTHNTPTQVLREAWKVVLDVRRNAKNNPEFYFDAPIEDFYRVMAMLSSQSYGSRIQNRFMQRLSLNKISARLAKGDAIDSKSGEYSEIKASLSVDGYEYNVVQIRLHHSIDKYYFIFVDVSSDPIEYVFCIPSKKLHELAENWEYAHGNKRNKSKKDKEDERRKTIKVGDEVWEWLQQYRIEVE